MLRASTFRATSQPIFIQIKKFKMPYEEASMLRAIDYARKHPKESKPQIATTFKVNITTLRRRLKGIQKSRQEAHRHQQLLSRGEENSIALWCRAMSDLGFPITFDILTTMAQDILKSHSSTHIIGQHWVQRFLSRNPDIKSTYVASMEKVRQDSGADQEAQDRFYITLEKVIKRYSIKAENLWNCDEKGIRMGKGNNRHKVIISVHTKLPSLAEDGSREFVTTLESISAKGDVIPPFIIWSNQSHREGFYGAGGLHAEDGTFGYSQSGYMDNTLGYEYMSKHFEPHTRPASISGRPLPWRLLLVDGHHSHIHWKVIEYALEHRIKVLCLPPHSTHFMQPLDVGCYGVLAKAYKKGLRNWVFKNPKVNITKPHFWELLVVARKITFTSETIQSAWKSSGCWPIDKNRGHVPSTPPPTNIDIEYKTMPTPAKIKFLGKQAALQARDDAQLGAIDALLEYSMEKITQYRTIAPEAQTLTKLRNGKIKAEINLKHLPGGRVMTRRDIQAGQKKSQQARLKDEKAIEMLLKKQQKAFLEGKPIPQASKRLRNIMSRDYKGSLSKMGSNGQRMAEQLPTTLGGVKELIEGIASATLQTPTTP